MIEIVNVRHRRQRRQQMSAVLGSTNLAVTESKFILKVTTSFTIQDGVAIRLEASCNCPSSCFVTVLSFHLLHLVVSEKLVRSTTGKSEQRNLDL